MVTTHSPHLPSHFLNGLKVIAISSEVHKSPPHTWTNPTLNGISQLSEIWKLHPTCLVATGLVHDPDDMTRDRAHWRQIPLS